MFVAKLWIERKKKMLLVSDKAQISCERTTSITRPVNCLPLHPKLQDNRKGGYLFGMHYIISFASCSRFASRHERIIYVCTFASLSFYDSVFTTLYVGILWDLIYACILTDDLRMFRLVEAIAFLSKSPWLKVFCEDWVCLLLLCNLLFMLN